MDLKLFAIGGYSEIGRNMTALKVNNDFIIIDMGVHLPTVIQYESEIEDLSKKEMQKIGAIPDDSILDQYRDNIKGIFIGHAHLDHCLASDTYIQLANGEIEQISNIENNTKIGCIDFNSMKYDPTYCTNKTTLDSPSRILEIRTKLKKIKATEEHKFLILDSNLNIKEKYAKDLKSDDFLVTVKNIPFKGKSKKLSNKFLPHVTELTDKGKQALRSLRKKYNLTQKELAEKINETRSNIDFLERNGIGLRILKKILRYCKINENNFLEKYTKKRLRSNLKFQVPSKTSSELCQFIGYVLGDGNSTKKDRKLKNVYIKCTDKDLENLGLYKKLGEKLFSVKGKIKIEERNRLAFSSPLLVRFLDSISEDILNNSPIRKIPKLIHKLPKKEIAGFLRGLYDAEGSVSDHSIVLASTSENIILITQMLLLRYGIYSHIYDQLAKNNPKLVRDSYQLVIYSPKSIKKFYNKIGFGSKIKLNNLKKIISKIGCGVGERIEIYPISNFLRNIICVFNFKIKELRKLGINEYHYFKGHCASLNKLKHLLKLLKNKYKYVKKERKKEAKFLIERLNNIIKSDILPEKIKKVNKIKSDSNKVIDITVPGHSNFIANGIIVHNCGAVPYMASKYDCPVYGTPYTIEFIKKVLKDKEIRINNNLKIISPNQKIKISDNITVEFIHMTHSIPQTAMIAVHTPKGTILYANDFKFDNNPILGKKPNYEKLKSLKNVILLVVDALYADRDGKTPSESVARELLKDVLLGTNNKGHVIIVTTFSSHIARLKSILEFGKALGRKVVFLGRSLNKYIDAAEKINLVKFSKKAEIIGFKKLIQRKLTQIEKEGRSNYLIVCTGHQGEPDAVLAKIVKGVYKFPIYPSDHVIFSSSIIPNKENIDQRKELDERLKKLGVRIFTEIHSSGHASREDLRDLINMVKPKLIIPAHADLPKLKAFIELAKEEGYKENKNVLILKDSEVLDVI